ncbi:MAG: hypothetical protein ACKVQU_26865 [Burkholderiales bacterium]
MAFAILSLGCASLGIAGDKSVQDEARDLADKIKKATQGGGAAPSEAAVKLPKGDPCKVLTDADVRKVFPDAKSGQRERRNEQYGMTACFWDYPGGRFAVQVSVEQPGTVKNEIRGMSLGFVDPLKAGAAANVRYETIKGVGDDAMAIVEPADAKRGILTDSAYLITQRGDQQAMLFSSTLARRDRAEALKKLEELGKAAAGRL